MPGLRCSSFSRAAFADNGPTRVRVYVCRGSGTLDTCGLRDDESALAFVGDLCVDAELGSTVEEDPDVVGGADGCGCD